MEKATYQQKRDQLLGEKIVKEMQKRKFEAYYCQTAEEAKNKVLELIPKNSVVTWGGSSTLQEIGVQEALLHGEYQVLDRAKAKNDEEREEIYRKAFFSDFYLASANAISENGVIINIDGTANRVAAICYGPKNVIIVAGMNKVAATEEAAMLRARTVAAPINQMRFMGNTPCSSTGTCNNCTAEDSICCEMLITRMSKQKNRIKVILVGEVLGY